MRRRLHVGGGRRLSGRFRRAAAAPPLAAARHGPERQARPQGSQRAARRVLARRAELDGGQLGAQRALGRDAGLEAGHGRGQLVALRNDVLNDERLLVGVLARGRGIGLRTGVREWCGWGKCHSQVSCLVSK